MTEAEAETEAAGGEASVAPGMEPGTQAGIRAGERICVTGASGFVGSHVVAELLARGHTVRGTVRDPHDAERTGHLHALAGRMPGSLELVAADLLDPPSMRDAISGCRHVCHVASVVKLRASDPQREIVDPALEGTRAVLAAVEAEPKVRRVVLTSSIAAILDEIRPLDHVFDESDWNESATLHDAPYPLAKRLAEREAWARAEAAHARGAAYSLVTINPTLVLGPVLSRSQSGSSPVLIRELASGRYPLIPNFHFGLVDVRDVAHAHVLALENHALQGRFIVSGRSAWFPEICELLRRIEPGTKVPRWRMPDALMYLVALFDKRLSRSFLRRSLGVARKIDARKSREVMGLEYRSLEATLRDTIQSYRELGQL